MIQDNILSDRLNKAKHGDLLIEPTPSKSPDELSQHEHNLIKNKYPYFLKICEGLLYLCSSLIRSIVYGAALNTIFSTEWKFLGMFAIGYSIDLLTTKLFNLFQRSTSE